MDNIRVTELNYKILGGAGGYFRIEDQRGIGIVDRSGKIIVRPYYTDVRICPEDGPVEMFVRCRHVSWLPENETVFDLVSPDGEVISQDNTGECIGFREGLAVVRDKFGIYCMSSNDKKQFIIHGKMLAASSYNALFHDGMLRVCDDLGFYFYYVDREGKKKTKSYQYASDYHQGLVSVAVERPLRMKYGMLDKFGRWVLRPRYDYVASSKASRVRVLNKGKYGYFDTLGKLCIPMIWDDANDFDESGTAFARMNYPPHSCIIDRRGQQLLLLPADCTNACCFSEDMLAAAKDRKWGYIDRDGHWMMNPQYDSCGDFSGGVAPVEKDGLWSFINSAGEEVMAVEGKLRIVSRGLAWSENKIYDYGY